MLVWLKSYGQYKDGVQMDECIRRHTHITALRAAEET